MKKRIIILFVLPFLFLSKGYAEKFADSSKMKRLQILKEYRKQLFMEKLQLSALECDNFLKIFDEYQLKQKEIRKEFKKKWQNKKPNDLTEAEAEIYLQDYITLKQKEQELFKSYSVKFKTVISSKQILSLPKIQKEVQKSLLAKAKELRKP